MPPKITLHDRSQPSERTEPAEVALDVERNAKVGNDKPANIAASNSRPLLPSAQWVMTYKKRNFLILRSTKKPSNFRVAIIVFVRGAPLVISGVLDDAIT